MPFSVRWNGSLGLFGTRVDQWFDNLFMWHRCYLMIYYLSIDDSDDATFEERQKISMYCQVWCRKLNTFWGKVKLTKNWMTEGSLLKRWYLCRMHFDNVSEYTFLKVKCPLSLSFVSFWNYGNYSNYTIPYHIIP